MGTPILLGGCKATLLDPKGQIGVEEKYLILLSACLMLLVVVPVICMALIFAYRYRASNLKSTYKPHWDFSYKIEMIVWGIPCLIVLILSIICWKSTHELDPATPLQSSVAPIEIDVVALDWKWLFIYPAQHIATVNEVAFPVNVPVRFEITSDTVMNSFFIPQLGSQIYAMAGMDARLHLIANEAGSYDGLSANFSGAGFSGMHFKALAGSQSDFDKWVATVKASPDMLTKATYPALAAASEDNPVHYYGSAASDLFGSIIGKYMKEAMPAPMPGHAAAMDTYMNAKSQGVPNVR